MRATILGLAMLAFAAATAEAQTPNARVFNGGAGLILYTIKPGSTADFEMVLNKTKEALAKSEKPERKQQAASWRVYKSDQAAANGNVTYVMIIDPALKDADYNIVEAAACSDRVPYPGMCDTIGAAYRRLVGLNLVRGFRRTVGEMFADVRGCTHITEMLMSLPTAAIQTFATFRRDDDDDGTKPFQLDRCHALETSSEAVRRYYPKWYRRAVEQR